MVRGKESVVCKKCGHVFEAWDIEKNATVESMPVYCPECGAENEVAPGSGLGIIEIFRGIFKRK